MKKHKIYVLLALSISISVWATPPKTNPLLAVAEDIADERIGKRIQVFNDQAALYSEPSEKSAKIQNFEIGTWVMIKSRMVANKSVNGYRDAWLQVESTKNQKQVVGYIWGGDLAIAGMKLNEGYAFAAGITGMKKGAEGEKTAEARVYQNGKVVSSVAFAPIDQPAFSKDVYAYNVGLEDQSSRGLTGESKLLDMNFVYEADDYPSGNQFFIWDYKKLTLGPQVSVVNSADYVVSTDMTFIYPKDAGGVKNCLQVKYNESPNGEDDEGAPAVPKTRYDYFKWDGKGLKKSDKCG